MVRKGLPQHHTTIWRPRLDWKADSSAVVFAIDQKMHAPHAIDTVADVVMVSAADAAVCRLFDQTNAILTHVEFTMQLFDWRAPQNIQFHARAHVFAAPFAVADFLSGAAGFVPCSSLISPAS